MQLHLPAWNPTNLMDGPHQGRASASWPAHGSWSRSRGYSPRKKHPGKGEAMALRLQSYHKLDYACDYVFATYKPHPNYGQNSDNLVCCKKYCSGQNKVCNVTAAFVKLVSLAA